MKREQLEAALGRKVTDAEWFVACALLEFIERNPDAGSLVDRCVERGLSVEETIKQLSKLPPPDAMF
jgi:hypothetical protein